MSAVEETEAPREVVGGAFGSDFASDEVDVQPVRSTIDMTKHADVAFRTHPLTFQVCVATRPGTSPAHAAVRARICR
jgi:hypothetical protein